MPRTPVALVGHIYKRLTVIEEAPRKGSRRMLRCRCECGKHVVVSHSNLRSGNTKSCGCMAKFRLRPLAKR